MSESDAAKKVRRMFRDLGSPPKPNAVVGNLTLPSPSVPREKSDRTEQLNLRVPAGFKKRVRYLATRGDISLAEVVIRAVALYEEKHGAASEE
jgi:hypothetical protein